MPGANRIPRVAFLTDSFHEVNGAALTCRELAAYARRSDYPFFSVRFAHQDLFEDTDPFWTLAMRRGPLSIGVDPDLRFDQHKAGYKSSGAELARNGGFRRS